MLCHLGPERLAVAYGEAAALYTDHLMYVDMFHYNIVNSIFILQNLFLHARMVFNNFHSAQ